MKVNVYVDGFNLYYGAVKGTPYRWLDLSRLCRNYLRSSDQINRIRYFTALVTNRPNDPGQRQRQMTYIRALMTISGLTVDYGMFLSQTRRMPLATPLSNGPKTIDVQSTSEKGSDVNLATRLLVDGFNKDFELALVLSNDSDLKLPIEVVRNELNLPVGVLNPHGSITSWALKGAASFYKPIRRGALAVSQFPITLTDSQGTFSKPSSW